ncbi:MAG TPA: hypothetical protein VEC60_09760 [Reyranella sp.]|nr:hypothetical protein [Reyranella sp.]
MIYDPRAGGDIVANLDFATDELVIFDGNGRAVGRWTYGEIIHAFASGRQRDHVLAHRSRPEVHLAVGDKAVYEAIRARAPQLRKLRGGWKTFLFIVEGLPDEVQTGVYLFAGLIVLGICSYLAGWFD